MECLREQNLNRNEKMKRCKHPLLFYRRTHRRSQPLCWMWNMSISVLGDFILLSFPSVEASLGMWRCIRKPRAPIVFHTRTGCLSQLVCWQGNPTARSVHSEARYGFDGENATVYERSRLERYTFELLFQLAYPLSLECDNRRCWHRTAML